MQDNNEAIAKRINDRRVEMNMSYQELADKAGMSKSSLQRYSTGAIKNIPLSRLNVLAAALDVTPEYIMGWDASPDTDDFDIFSIRGINPPEKTRKVPRLGTIACGEPMLAVENVEEYDDVPDELNCDFTLVCKGDSMINARINDGDLVYIRLQPDVENGEIAVVLIDDEATLKRVYKEQGQIVLMPENRAYQPLMFVGEKMNEVRILGKAIEFRSKVK